MTADERVERCMTRSGREVSQLFVAQVAPPLFHTLCAPSEAAQRAQDAPRALMANSDRLAITKLARPNRLNSCAVFLASPL